jgi:hypothetical protein
LFQDSELTHSHVHRTAGSIYVKDEGSYEKLQSQRGIAKSWPLDLARAARIRSHYSVNRNGTGTARFCTEGLDSLMLPRCVRLFTALDLFIDGRALVFLGETSRRNWWRAVDALARNPGNATK